MKDKKKKDDINEKQKTSSKNKTEEFNIDEILMKILESRK
jgi:hypothetical protein